MLPGPGSELRPMFVDQVMPRLEARDIAFANDAFLQMRVCGIGESALETLLQPLFVPYGDSLKVAYCASDGLIDVRLGSNGEALKWAEIESLGERCRDLLDLNFVGYGEATPAEIVLRHLRVIQKTFAVAESCTGGLVGSAFTDIPGASKVFQGGLVCYNNDIKVSLLGVPESIVQQHGAVSAECAVAMATAAQERFEADYGVSITGYAGPSGGTAQAPVGTVFIGFASPHGVWSHKSRIIGSRLSVRQRAATLVVDWMRRKLIENETRDVLDSLAF
jgi:nicotinamide-nucleotide amidase